MARHRRQPIPMLTARERMVLHFVSTGHATKHIAKCLGLSPNTVEMYRTSLRIKLGARNTVELLRAAMVLKLVRWDA
jgi:DNA-binding CsgD family transcriptional regulator